MLCLCGREEVRVDEQPWLSLAEDLHTLAPRIRRAPRTRSVAMAGVRGPDVCAAGARRGARRGASRGERRGERGGARRGLSNGCGIPTRTSRHSRGWPVGAGLTRWRGVIDRLAIRRRTRVAIRLFDVRCAVRERILLDRPPAADGASLGVALRSRRAPRTRPRKRQTAVDDAGTCHSITRAQAAHQFCGIAGASLEFAVALEKYGNGGVRMRISQAMHWTCVDQVILKLVASGVPTVAWQVRTHAQIVQGCPRSIPPLSRLPPLTDFTGSYYAGRVARLLWKGQVWRCVLSRELRDCGNPIRGQLNIQARDHVGV